jgi:hypothetical protein
MISALAEPASARMNASASLDTFGTETMAASRSASAFTLAVTYAKIIAMIAMRVTTTVRIT